MKITETKFGRITSFAPLHSPPCSKGPWQRTDIGLSQIGIVAPPMKHRDGSDIAKVYVNAPRTKGRNPEFVGNLQIIEAAWDMLDALQYLKLALGNCGATPFAQEALNKMDAAINRATVGWPDDLRRLPVSSHPFGKEV